MSFNIREYIAQATNGEWLLYRYAFVGAKSRMARVAIIRAGNEIVGLGTVDTTDPAAVLAAMKEVGIEVVPPAPPIPDVNRDFAPPIESEEAATPKPTKKSKGTPPPAEDDDEAYG